MSAAPAWQTTLLDCLSSPAGTPPPDLSRLLAGHWQDLLEGAARQGVAPLLHVRLLEWGAQVDVPAGLRSGLSELYTQSLVAGLRTQAELRACLLALRSAGIPVMVLKGAYLAEAVYGQVALRPMGDIDLLVPEPSLAAAERALIELGYGPDQRPPIATQRAQLHHLLPLTRAGHLPVEIHWTVGDRSRAFSLDIQRFWDCAVPAHIAGVDVLAMHPHDLLYYLCLHASHQHAFELKLKHMCDIAACVARFDHAMEWDAFSTRVCEHGGEQFVFRTLAVAAALTGAVIPARVLEHRADVLQDQPMSRIIGEYILADGAQLHGMEQLLRAARLRHSPWPTTRQMLLPSPHVLREIYGLAADSPHVWLYYLYRPLDLLLRRGLIGLSIFTGTGRGRDIRRQHRRRQSIRRWLGLESDGVERR